MRLFNPDSPLMQALGKLSDVIFCNIMFCLFSLPVFTIGASLTALYSCMQKLVADTEDDLVARDFWRAFKSNFKQSTLIWLLCLLVVGFLTLFYYVANSMLDTLGRGYLIPFYLLSILFLFGFQYFFPIQARYKLRVRDTLKNSFLLSIAALPWTVLTIAVTVGAIYISFFMDPNGINMALFLWMAAGFGILCYLNCFLFQQAFKKLDPAQIAAQEAAAAPAEAVFIDDAHRTDAPNLHQGSTFSDPDWNRQEYPLSDRKDVQGKKYRRRKK